MDYTPSTLPNEKANALIDMVPEMVKEERAAHAKIKSLMRELREMDAKVKAKEMELFILEEKNKAELAKVREELEFFKSRVFILRNQVQAVGLQPAVPYN